LAAATPPRVSDGKKKYHVFHYSFAFFTQNNSYRLGVGSALWLGSYYAGRADEQPSLFGAKATTNGAVLLVKSHFRKASWPSLRAGNVFLFLFLSGFCGFFGASFHHHLSTLMSSCYFFSFKGIIKKGFWNKENVFFP